MHVYTHLTIYQSVLVFQAPKNVTGACNESVNMGKQLYYGEYIQKSICPESATP